MLLEVEGHWVLTDPVWSDRVSPSRAVGPRRNHPVPLTLADLPRLDAVLISHDHYDHLDTDTIDTLLTRAQPRATTSRSSCRSASAEHLSAWGVPDDRIVELDWDESHTVGA